MADARWLQSCLVACRWFVEWWSYRWERGSPAPAHPDYERVGIPGFPAKSGWHGGVLALGLVEQRRRHAVDSESFRRM